MQIKVLVISNYSSYLSSRPEAELFIGLKKEGIDVTIMTDAGSKWAETFRNEGIKVIDFSLQSKFDKTGTKAIRQTIIQGRFQIVMLFNSKAIINGLRAAKGLPVKTVLYRGFVGNIHFWDPTSYFKYLHPRADKIFCIAKAVEEHIHKQKFCKNSKTITITKGHNPEWYRSVMPADLNEFGVNSDHLVFTFVGNDRRMKGVKYLLGAVALLPEGLKIKFIFVGRNIENHRLAKNEIVKKYAVFTGFRNDSLQIVKASDVFVLPSIKGEAITKALIEAMSLGIAPLMTDIPGNRNLVIHEKCGIVVPSKNKFALKDAILKFYNNRELVDLYGKEAEKHVIEHYHINDTVKNTKALFEELAKDVNWENAG